jgi:Fic family protein
MVEIYNSHEHICFQKHWHLKPEIHFLTGQCYAIIKAISNTPIRPDYREKLLGAALIRGAQATTAIEGNTLTIEEIQDLQHGKKLPPSREYLQKEVENILNALNTILNDIIVNDKISLIKPDMIKYFHRMVGGGLGDTFDAIPGEYRKRNVIAGSYRPPNQEKVSEYIDHLCTWLEKEFHFLKGQSFIDTIVQAVVTHMYIAWIHPFSDGNGRTARLVEFYLLIRAGVPDIASHVLSNFYNLTRSEYYRQIDKAIRQNDITDFLFYAIRGFTDGLVEVLDLIQENQLIVTWRNYIFGIFEKQIAEGKDSKTAKRKRDLILKIPHAPALNSKQILELDPNIFRVYQDISNRTFLRDLEDLVTLKLLRKEGPNYIANIDTLRTYMAVSR